MDTTESVIAHAKKQLTKWRLSCCLSYRVYRSRFLSSAFRYLCTLHVSQVRVCVYYSFCQYFHRLLAISSHLPLFSCLVWFILLTILSIDKEIFVEYNSGLSERTTQEAVIITQIYKRFNVFGSKNINENINQTFVSKVICLKKYTFLIFWESFRQVADICPFFNFHFHFYSMIRWNGKIHLMTSSFLLGNTRCGLLTGIGWSVSFSTSLRILCILFYRTDSGLCIYHLPIWSNYRHLYNF